MKIYQSILDVMATAATNYNIDVAVTKNTDDAAYNAERMKAAQEIADGAGIPTHVSFIDGQISSVSVGEIGDRRYLSQPITRK